MPLSAAPKSLSQNHKSGAGHWISGPSLLVPVFSGGRTTRLYTVRATVTVDVSAGSTFVRFSLRRSESTGSALVSRLRARW